MSKESRKAVCNLAAPTDLLSKIGLGLRYLSENEHADHHLVKRTKKAHGLYIVCGFTLSNP